MLIHLSHWSVHGHMIRNNPHYFVYWPKILNYCPPSKYYVCFERLKPRTLSTSRLSYSLRPELGLRLQHTVSYCNCIYRLKMLIYMALVGNNKPYNNILPIENIFLNIDSCI